MFSVAAGFSLRNGAPRRLKPAATRELLESCIHPLDDSERIPVMKQLLRVSRLVLLICVIFGVSSSTVSADKSAPPNWIVTSTGTATLAAFDGTYRTDIDAFSGNSSHLGKFTAEGYHVLNVFTGEFAG